MMEINNSDSTSRWTANVEEAIETKNWEKLRNLLNHVKNFRDYDSYLCDVLCRGVQSSNYDLVEVLCEEGSVDPCQTSNVVDGQSPLQIAYSQCNIQILSTLISALHMLDKDRRETDKKNTRKNKKDSAHFKCCECPTSPTGLPKDILTAACKGDITQIKSWLEADNDVNAICSESGMDGSSLVHAACLFSQDMVIHALMEHPKLHLNTKNSRGWTSLVCAVYGAFVIKENTDEYHQSSTNCVNMLVENKLCLVSVLSPNENGNTALALGVMDELPDVIKIMLKEWKQYQIHQVHHALEHLIEHQRWEYVQEFLKNYKGDRISYIALREILKLAIEKENFNTILLMLENEEWRRKYPGKFIDEDIKRMLHKSLHGAVRGNHIDLVKVLVEKIDLDYNKVYLRYNTSPREEANSRGYTKILDILSKLEKKNPVRHIEKILEDIVKREKRIFEHIKVSKCVKTNEIKPLLEGENKSQCDMPWTIRDENGASILHHLVSSSFIVDIQYDIKNEIKQVLKSKDGPYINAVDFEGKTCLHYLAELKNIHLSYCKIKKDRQEARIIDIIKLLIEFGANATVLDYSGKLPEELTKLPKTKFFLEMERQSFALQNRYEHENGNINQCVLEEASNGNDALLKMHLLKVTKTLRSQGSYSGPLHIAIARGHWKTLQLLLSAGAPLSDISNEDFTVLETAYRTENLHDRMNALIRNEYIKQLNYEIGKVKGNALVRKKLRLGIRILSEDIRLKGYQAKWPRQACYHDNWKLLITAASLGLSIACHFICIEPSTRISRLPGDTHYHPVLLSLQNSQLESHFETVRVLCIDHKLPPYHLPLEQEYVVKKIFNNDLFLEEFEKMEHLALTNIDCINIPMVKKMSSPNLAQYNICVDHRVLRFLAENGLIHTLHKIVKNTQLDLNVMIDSVTRSGLIHIAARYGHLALVEYLVMSGVNTSICARGKLTPAHLAALFGHERCLEYLKSLPGGKEPNQTKMNPQFLFKGFQRMVNTLKLKLLEEEEINKMYNDPKPRVAAQTLLKSKGEQFGITSPNKLYDCAVEKKVELENHTNSRVKKAFDKLFKSLICKIGKLDYRFKGELVPAGSVSEGIRLHLLDELDYNVVLEFCNAMDNGNIKIENEQIESKLKAIKLIPDEAMSTYESRLFKERNIITDFIHMVRKVLSDPSYEFEIPNISLVYPGISETQVGIALYFVWSENDGKPFILLPSVDLVPTFHAPIPEDSGLIKLSQEHQNLLKNKNASIVCCGKDKWRYSLSNFENVLLSNLQPNQRAVILACKLMCSFLKPDWWYPEEYKRFYKRWEKIYLKMDVPVSYVIKAAFTQRLADNPNQDTWTKESFITHVIDIFKKMVDEESGKPKQVQSFFVPSYESQRFGDGADDILEYLNRLKDSGN